MDPASPPEMFTDCHQTRQRLSMRQSSIATIRFGYLAECAGWLSSAMIYCNAGRMVEQAKNDRLVLTRKDTSFDLLIEARQ
jgi:hypothetical protein